MASRIWMVTGSLLGLMAVAMAAYASHGLPPDRASLGMTAAQVGAWHGLALLAAGLLAERRHGVLVHLAAGAMALGSVAFCGGVWLRAVWDLPLGAVTPGGGMLLMLGWLLLAIGACVRDR